MYIFYVLLDGKWEWALNAHPTMLQDAQQMMEAAFGKAAVKREFRKVDHED